MTDQKLEKLYISLSHGQGPFLPSINPVYSKHNSFLLWNNVRKTLEEFLDTSNSISNNIYKFEAINEAGKYSDFVRLNPSFSGISPISSPDNSPSNSLTSQEIYSDPEEKVNLLKNDDNKIENIINLSEHLREDYYSNDSIPKNKGNVTIFHTYDTKPLVLVKTVNDFIERREDTDEFVIME